MKNTPLIMAGSGLLLLTACGAPKSTELTELLKNPLYAEQYYDAQTDHMVDLLIESGALLNNPSAKAAIEHGRTQGLALARKATDIQAKGKLGGIVSDTEEAMGEALLLDNTLYIGPEFVLKPSVNAHVYLSTVLDPRDGVFPDETAIDLGPVRSAFDSAVYPVSLTAEQYTKIRSLAIYDVTLKRLLGFAQLSGQ